MAEPYALEYLVGPCGCARMVAGVAALPQSLAAVLAVLLAADAGWVCEGFTCPHCGAPAEALCWRAVQEIAWL